MTNMQLTSTGSPSVPGYPARWGLHVEPRPFETPCARCGAHDNIDDQAPTMANDHGCAVCSGCISRLQLSALTFVRDIDAAYCNMSGPRFSASPEALRDASEWLRTIAAGVAEVFAFHCNRDDLLAFRTVVNSLIEQRRPDVGGVE